MLPDLRYELTKCSRYGLMHDGCRVCYPTLKILAACCRGGFERLWHADRLRHRQRFKFKLAANQDQPTEEDGPGHQEVGQNWHSHRLAPNIVEQLFM